MALSYPEYFPKDFLGPVVAAEAAAERRFRKIATPDDYTEIADLKSAAREYVRSLVLAFGRQVCAAVTAGEVSAAKIGELVDDFEHHVSVHAYYHLELGQLWSRWESFRDDVEQTTHRSAGWLKHLNDRVRCAARGEAQTEIKSIRITAQRRMAVIGPLLKQKGWSRSKWADKAGVDPSVVYDYLAGKSNPTQESRTAMAHAVGLADLPH